MATVLMAWELGMGLGHMATLKPIAAELARRGHRVALALRNLSRAKLVFGELNLAYYQAPFHVRRGEAPKTALAYVHLLENIGFAEPADLAARVAQWRAIYDEIRPDVLVYEHAPTALLAARGYSFRQVLVGTGFTCPPCEEGLPLLRAWQAVEPTQIQSDEARLTSELNQLLRTKQAPQLETLSDLYGQIDETFILSFAELDHFERPGPCDYHGVWSLSGGEGFSWPAGEGPRVFAYLKPSPAVSIVLGQLATWRFPTVVYSDGLDDSLIHEHSSATLRFTKSPLEMRQIGAECDLGICNGNHATTAALLRAGRPLFLSPISLEQILLAIRLKRAGLAIAVAANDLAGTEAWLRDAFENKLIRESASRFAQKYARYDETATVNGIVDRIERLAVPRRPNSS